MSCSSTAGRVQSATAGVNARIRAAGFLVLRIGVSRYLVPDLLQFGLVRDALEVVAGSVRPFERGEFFRGELDLERGDRIIDLGGRIGADEGRDDDWLAVQPGQGDLGSGDAPGFGDGADGTDDGAKVSQAG